MPWDGLHKSGIKNAYNRAHLLYLKSDVTILSIPLPFRSPDLCRSFPYEWNTFEGFALKQLNNVYKGTMDNGSHGF